MTNFNTLSNQTLQEELITTYKSIDDLCSFFGIDLGLYNYEDIISSICYSPNNMYAVYDDLINVIDMIEEISLSQSGGNKSLLAHVEDNVNVLSRLGKQESVKKAGESIVYEVSVRNNEEVKKRFEQPSFAKTSKIKLLRKQGSGKPLWYTGNIDIDIVEHVHSGGNVYQSEKEFFEVIDEINGEKTFHRELEENRTRGQKLISDGNIKTIILNDLEPRRGSKAVRDATHVVLQELREKAVGIQNPAIVVDSAKKTSDRDVVATLYSVCAPSKMFTNI